MGRTMQNGRCLVIMIAILDNFWHNLLIPRPQCVKGVNRLGAFGKFHIHLHTEFRWAAFWDTGGLNSVQSPTVTSGSWDPFLIPNSHFDTYLVWLATVALSFLFFCLMNLHWNWMHSSPPVDSHVIMLSLLIAVCDLTWVLFRLYFHVDTTLSTMSVQITDTSVLICQCQASSFCCCLNSNLMSNNQIQ